MPLSLFTKPEGEPAVADLRAAPHVQPLLPFSIGSAPGCRANSARRSARGRGDWLTTTSTGVQPGKLCGSVTRWANAARLSRCCFFFPVCLVRSAMRLGSRVRRTHAEERKTTRDRRCRARQTTAPRLAPKLERSNFCRGSFQLASFTRKAPQAAGDQRPSENDYRNEALALQQIKKVH